MSDVRAAAERLLEYVRLYDLQQHEEIVHDLRAVASSVLKSALAEPDELQEAVELLRPFADFAEGYEQQPLRGIDEDETYCIHNKAGKLTFRISDCRKARAFLAKHGGQK